MKKKALKSFPSVSDISEQTRAEFESAGDGVEPITISTQGEAEQEIAQLSAQLVETQEWDTRTKAINRGIALVNGGALRLDAFRKGLPGLYPDLVSAATNLRSALLKQACIFISQLSRELGSSFDALGDFVTPLSALIGHGTQIIADSCRFAILSIARNTKTKKVFAALCELCSAKGAIQRALAANCMAVVTSSWPVEIVDARFDAFSVIMRKLICDSAPETRLHARAAIRNMKATNPKRAGQLMATLDEKTRNSIEAEEVSLPPAKLEPKQETKKAQNKQKSEDSTKKLLSARSTQSEKGVAKVSKITQPRTRLARSETPKKEHKGNTAIEQERSKQDALKNKRSASVKRDVKPKIDLQVQKATKITQQIEKPKMQQNCTQKQQQQKTKNMFDGNEKEFLLHVKEIISAGNVNDLQEEIPSTASTVLKCCMSSSTEISKIALTILHDLIPAFSPTFSLALSKMMTLLIKITQGTNSANSKLALNILNTFPLFFGANELVQSLIQQQPSPIILSLASAISSKIPLSDEKLCFKLLHLSNNTLTSMDVKERHMAGEVMRNIFVSNITAFNQFSADLSPPEREKFNSFASSYIPQIGQMNDFSVPHYTDKTYGKWVKELENVCNQHCLSNDWSTISGIVFDEINCCVLARKESSAALSLAFRLIKKYGANGFQKMLPSLLAQPDSQTKDSIIASIISSTGILDMCIVLSSFINEGDTELSAPSLSVLIRIIGNSSNDEIESISSIIGKCLSRAICSEQTSVRKKAVLGFVEFKMRHEQSASQYISSLLPQQQKLIAVYYGKRCSGYN